jgi:hypothetical protein
MADPVSPSRRLRDIGAVKAGAKRADNILDAAVLRMLRSQFAR